MGQFDNTIPVPPKVSGFRTGSSPEQKSTEVPPPAPSFRMTDQQIAEGRNAAVTPNRADAYREAMQPKTSGYTAEEYKNMPWSQYVPILASNIGPGIGDVFTDTAQLGYDVMKGAVSKGQRAIGYEGNEENEAVIDALSHPSEMTKAIVEDYKTRYGAEGSGEFWKHLAEEPVSYAMDAATVIPLFGQATTAAGIISKTGKTAKAAEAAKLLDPFQTAISAPGAIATAGVKTVSKASGVPSEIIKKAYEIGRYGKPEEINAFISTIKNDVNFEEIAGTVRNSVEELGQQARIDYISNINKSSIATAPVDIRESINTADDLVNYMIPGGPAGARIMTQTDEAYALQAIKSFTNIQNTPNPTIAITHDVREQINSAASIVGDSRIKSKLSNIAVSIRNAMTDVDPAYGVAMDGYKKYINDIDKIVANIGRETSSNATKSNRIMKDFISGSNTIKIIERTPSGQYLSAKMAGIASKPWLGSKASMAIDTFGGMGGALIAYMGHPFALVPIGAGAITTSPRIASTVARAIGRAGRLGNYPEPIKNYFVKPVTGTITHPAVTNLGSQVGSAMYTDERPGRKAGGRVGTSHEDAADRLVNAAERAKKEISRGTESLLDTPDDHVAAALEIANRSI